VGVGVDVVVVGAWVGAAAAVDVGPVLVVAEAAAVVASD
jgi:hypothetical protein